MKLIVLFFSLALSLNSFAYTPPLVGADDSRIYCSSSDVVIMDSKYYTVAPGEVIDINADARGFCESYVKPESDLSVGISFRDDPKWIKNKDQIKVNGFKLEVFDVESGLDMLSLASSYGMQACNTGRGFNFLDLLKQPRVLRPLKIRLTNVGRSARDVAATILYSALNLQTVCGNYPKGN